MTPAPGLQLSPGLPAVSLGRLEALVMGCLWEIGEPVSVREVASHLNGPWAYTTLMTTLDRLFKKDLATREPRGRAFVYRARFSRRDLGVQALQRAVSQIHDGSETRDVAVAALVDVLESHDPEWLDSLDRLVREEADAATGSKSRGARMTLYGLALLLVVLGGLIAAFDAMLLVATPTLLKRLLELPPAQRPTATLLCRFAPVGLSFLIVVGVFLPAWVRHEPANTGEEVSTGLMGLALLSLLPLLHGVRRGARMYFKTRDRLQGWRRRGRDASGAETPFEIVEVKSEDLALCVGGFLRPTIYASTEVRSSLEPEEFSAALLHEVSHASARDPLRLLWMASCPDFLQLFGLDEPWRRAFSRACEFAADADAHGGSPELALDLASALLKVARLRARPLNTEPLMDVAVSSAYFSRVDLQARVEALANPAPELPARFPVVHAWIFAAVVVVVCGFGAVVSPQVHELVETVGRLLAS